MNWHERIVVDPEVMGGKPVIKGTRVPVQVVVGSLAGGSTVDAVCDAYSITADDVRAALAYAAEMLGQERLYALPGG
ncbi:MAG: DUF433 domain-containing protein [Chloroflexi bacterium]|nr:DUF433 domain-containing protein [Chloroflexota bacterium]